MNGCRMATADQTVGVLHASPAAQPSSEMLDCMVVVACIWCMPYYTEEHVLISAYGGPTSIYAQLFSCEGLKGRPPRHTPIRMSHMKQCRTNCANAHAPSRICSVHRGTSGMPSCVHMPHPTHEMNGATQPTVFRQLHYWTPLRDTQRRVGHHVSVSGIEKMGNMCT